MPTPWQSSWESFELSEARSDETLRVYRTSLADFGEHLIATKGSAIELIAVSRDDVRGYLHELAKAGKAPATQHMRFRSLRCFFGWLAAERDIVSPVDGVKAPKLDKPKTTVLSASDIKRLLRTCGGKDFAQRRDQALLRVLLEGPRRGEVVSMQVGLERLHLKRHESWAEVTGKTGRRILNLSNPASYAIKLYIELRAQHPDAASSALWLGKRGPLGPDAVYAIVERRALQAGLDGVHPHEFRHTFANDWLAAGGTEGGLMRAAGWTSRAMIDRYASSQASERARDEHHRLGLGDRF
jgi:site-specific recombinase XerD